MAGKGLKPNTLLPWRSSLFIEVTRGTATSPGRDAILSQLTPLPPPSPSATVFFHIPPFATTHFCYPLLGHFTMLGHQSMQSLNIWYETVGILCIAHTFFCYYEAWKIWCNSQNIQCRHIICLIIKLGVYSPERWELFWKLKCPVQEHNTMAKPKLNS